MSALSFQQATIGYSPKLPILRDVNFELEFGVVAGLIGPNGAGKSTLVKALLGEAQLLSGDLRLCDQPNDTYSYRERAQLVGVVPQTISVPFPLSALEFVTLGRAPHQPFGWGAPDEHADREAVREAMRLTDTEYYANAPIDQLSGGELQRLYIAQALAVRPRVLLLDEPTSHLDINHRLQIMDVARDLATCEGLAVLTIFHDFDLASNYADALAVVYPRAVESESGTVQSTTSTVSSLAHPREVLTSEMFAEVFGVEAQVAQWENPDQLGIRFTDRIPGK